MAVSYRGKTVNMLALSRKNEHKIALGNSHQNARGDIIGRGGVILKSREEQIKEYEENIVKTEGQESMKNEALSDLEKNLKKYMSKPEKIVSKKKKEEVKEEAKEELDEIIYDEE